MKTALITGVTGQDGRHLSRFLLNKNYKVFGMVNGQRNSIADSLQISDPNIFQVKGDLADRSSLVEVLRQTEPDEIYNLGAISFVGLSFSQPELTANVTGVGVLRLLDALRQTGLNDKAKVYQASSSEMFGKVRETPQNELTPFHPRSPYGVAKAFAHHACVNYREAYGMHVSCGILFNHEGEFRGSEFVTRKITQTVAKIKLGLADEIRLGDLTPLRDWGYARDYVEAMWMMLQRDTPDDYVIATGIAHSVREFLDAAFEVAGMPGQADRYLIQDSAFMRPSEVHSLIGDASKATSVLGWKPRTDFKTLVELMVENDIRLLS